MLVLPTSRPGRWRPCSARVAAEAGPELAGLVYCVGTIHLRPLARLTSADFLRDFRLDAEGAALAVQASLPALEAYAGTASVTLFSTVAVHQGSPRTRRSPWPREPSRG